ncbi:hypothetical protein ACUNWD_09990 [Sunxiuqinia sp. A32]|uniref:hypothetical protein n=1 Tax=Sunxiuqinia sp. A32 TaxID=3461496 RepID=UPI004045E70B
MKKVSELNANEKRNLLKCFQRGIISPKEIDEDTLVIENAEDWFESIVRQISARRNNTQCEKLIVIYDPLRGYIQACEDIIMNNVKKKRANLFEGVAPFNVINLGPGEDPESKSL